MSHCKNYLFLMNFKIKIDKKESKFRIFIVYFIQYLSLKVCSYEIRMLFCFGLLVQFCIEDQVCHRREQGGSAAAHKEFPCLPVRRVWCKCGQLTKLLVTGPQRDNYRSNTYLESFIASVSGIVKLFQKVSVFSAF